MAISSLLELILRSRKEGDAASKTAEELRQFKKETKDSTEALKPLNDAATKAGLALAALGAAGTAFIGSATRLAARVETLGVVTVQLGKNVGQTEDEIRSLEQAVADQGITLQATRTAIARMIQADIDLAHATELARLAQDAAVIANLNSSEAFEQLINVIVTGNVRMGRTIGLQLQFGSALQDTADRLGKNVDDLTDYEIIQSRTNEVLRQGVNIQGTYTAAMETAGKQVLSLDRHIEESRRIIGEAYLPLFADLVGKVTEVLQAFESLGTVQQRGIAVSLGMVTAWASVLGAGLLIIPMINNFKNALIALGIAGQGALGPIGLLVGLIVTLSTLLVTANAKTKAAIGGFEDLRKQVKSTGGDFKEYKRLVMESVEGTQLSARAHDMAARAHIEYEEALWKVLIAEGAIREENWKYTHSQDEVNVAIQRSVDDMNNYRVFMDGLLAPTNNLTGASDNYWRSLLRMNQAMERTSGSMEGIGKAAGFAGGSVDLNLTGSIIRFMEEIEFFLAGGLQIQQAFEDVKRALELGRITPEEAQEYLATLFVAAEDLQVDLGNLTADEAAKNIQDQLGGTFGQAKKDLDEVDAKLKALERDIYIKIYVEYETRGNIPGYQQGGSFTIQGPPGPDRVPVFFMGTRGEQVDITPRGQAGSGGGGLSIGNITVTVGSGASGAMIVDEMMAEINRRVQQANISGAGYIGV
jgi:uncharacterized protein YukE